MEYLVNEQGERTRVVLTVDEYEDLLDAASEQDDIRRLDEALERRRRGEDDPLPLEEAVKEIEEERRQLHDPGKL